MKVRDPMTEDVLTFTPGRSLRDAAKFMADHNVGAVVVMDPEQPGPGIFTERDLVRSIGKGENPDCGAGEEFACVLHFASPICPLSGSGRLRLSSSMLTHVH